MPDDLIPPDDPCPECGEPVEKYTGDPSRWPVRLPRGDDVDTLCNRHEGCVMAAIRERKRLQVRVEELEGLVHDCEARVEELEALTASLAERCAAQSELLSQRAERSGP